MSHREFFLETYDNRRVESMDWSTESASGTTRHCINAMQGIPFRPQCRPAT